MSQRTRIQTALVSEVYVRPVRSADALNINGETEGYEWDPNLRCDRFVWRAGVQPGFAELTYVPLDGEVPDFVDVLGRYSIDDQVRVQIGRQGSTEGLTVFEGVLARQPFEAVRQGGREAEGLRFVATPMAQLDDRLTEHLVIGRWMYDEASSKSFTATALDLPAVFNFRGRSNMDAAEGHVITTPGDDGFSGKCFTHDDDTTGEFWTGRDAILALLAARLYGTDDAPLHRSVCVEPATLTALTAISDDSSASSDRWRGLNARLPEVDVRGLGVFSAIDRVCQVIGFQFSLLPDMSGDESIDRLYVFRLWRKGGGPLTDLLLPKRGEFTGSAASDLDNANFSILHAMRDATATVPEVFAAAPLTIECSVPLKPLWSPDNMGTVAIDASLQQALSPATTTNDYYRRHVAGGDEFDQYGHVGRMWGIDCTGAFQAAGLGYPAENLLYAHDDGGFDWLGFLGINGDDAISKARIAAGLAEPIVWCRRLRLPLPLTQAITRRYGQDFVLEVCEDATVDEPDWTPVDLRYSTLADQFGILITNVPNLAAINLSTIGAVLPPADPMKSWWGLIHDQKLQFRLTCRVEGDNASEYYAKIQGSAATWYPMGRLINVAAEEIWAAPKGLDRFSAGDDFELLDGNDAATNVADAARRRRDAWEGGRVVADVGTWLMNPTRWRVGDRVWGVRGRDISFATGGGDTSSSRYPAIVAVQVELTDNPQMAQGITLQLHDEAFEGAGADGRAD